MMCELVGNQVYDLNVRILERVKKGVITEQS
jgi:hypothetical protein